jgi:hypothetical protein
MLNPPLASPKRVLERKTVHLSNDHAFTVEISTVPIIRRKKRLRCCPSLPKSKIASERRDAWRIKYLPTIILCILGLVVFIAITKFGFKSTLVTYSPNSVNQAILRSMDSPNGKKKKGDLLEEWEIVIYQKCEFARTTVVDANELYHNHCKDICGQDLGIVTVFVAQLCSIMNSYSASNRKFESLSGLSVCEWPNMHCNSDNQLTNILLDSEPVDFRFLSHQSLWENLETLEISVDANSPLPEALAKRDTSNSLILPKLSSLILKNIHLQASMDIFLDAAPSIQSVMVHNITFNGVLSEKLVKAPLVVLSLKDLEFRDEFPDWLKRTTWQNSIKVFEVVNCKTMATHQ